MKAAFKRGPLARWPVLQRFNETGKCSDMPSALLAKVKSFGSLRDRWRAGLWKCFLNSPKVDPKVYNTADSQVVTQPGTDGALQDLTSVIEREPVFSLWCGRRRRERVKSCSMAQTMR